MTLCAEPPSPACQWDDEWQQTQVRTPDYRLVIVDDDPAFTAALAALIDVTAGLTVAAIAATVSEAIAMFATMPVDLALIDVKMPNGGGLAVLDALAASKNPTPVVLMSTGPKPTGTPRHTRFVDKADLSGPSLRLWASTTQQ